MAMIAQKLDKVDLLAPKLDQVLASKQSNQPVLPSCSNQPLSETCALCASSNHCMEDCPTAAQLPPFIQEQVQLAQGFTKSNHDPFSNSYNPGWRNHPNFF